ncbi:hypothetical protein [Mesorhizobium tianshanense]|uniref:hypothetical protein n=1 Tax=Mesorhizobium tianshanense TaxID=39844 RepID=UPI0012DDB39D|nr:hypothetical protein [Mesorhizobium tianshanense]
MSAVRLFLPVVDTFVSVAEVARALVDLNPTAIVTSDGEGLSTATAKVRRSR